MIIFWSENIIIMVWLGFRHKKDLVWLEKIMNKKNNLLFHYLLLYFNFMLFAYAILYVTNLFRYLICQICVTRKLMTSSGVALDSLNIAICLHFGK